MQASPRLHTHTLSQTGVASKRAGRPHAGGSVLSTFNTTFVASTIAFASLVFSIMSAQSIYGGLLPSVMILRILNGGSNTESRCAVPHHHTQGWRNACQVCHGKMPTTIQSQGTSIYQNKVLFMARCFSFFLARHPVRCLKTQESVPPPA